MHDPDSNRDPRDREKAPEKHTPEVEKDKKDEHEEDLLDESLKETFPASDPPSTY